MSVGLQLLRSLVENGSRSEFRNLSEVLFVGDETPVYEFVSTHYRRHGQLPSVEALVENGFVLPRSTEPPSYYLDRARNRAIFNTINAQNSDLGEAMRDRDMARAVEILRATTYSVNRYEAVNDIAALHEVATSVMEDYEIAARTTAQGITLGWSYLDAITSGAEGGDVITLVARPGMGKSWLIAYMASQAWRAGASVLFVSMEMTDRQIARRMIGLHAGFNPDFIRRGQLSFHARDAAYTTIREMEGGAPFHMMRGSFDKSVASVDAAIQQFSPDIVYIDASYLMSPSGSKGYKKPNELLADVGREVKETALARNKPIVQTVQFNREQRKSKGKPDLIHIGGTDIIGQTSTIAIGVQAGEGNNKHTTRKLSLMKSRESSDDVEFTTEFKFAPPTFSWIPEPNAEDDDGEPTPEQSADTAWQT